MTEPRIQGKQQPTAPLKPKAQAPAPASKAPVRPPSAQTKPLNDGKHLSQAATDALHHEPAGGAAHHAWEENVVLPVKVAQQYWENMGHQGGVAGVAGKVMGTLLDVSGIPSIVKDTGKALDNRLSVKERLSAGAWAAGNVAINFVPIGKVGKVGSKVFKITGGAKVLQKIRNVTLLGAEVKAGTVIKHFTNAEAAAAIAKEGILGGSKRGFLSLAGKGEHLAVTAKGLEQRALNNGQIYAAAADGATTKLASVVDAIVGVGHDTKLGQILGKVSPPKTGYSHVVEHVLTAEEAAGARRWGRTIVTNVPVGKKGLAVAAHQVKAVPGAIAKGAAPKVAAAHHAENMVGQVLQKAAHHGDMVAFGYVKGLQAAAGHDD
jgi:hypothetical protein